ncbi:MAG: hypothetical protein ACT4PS_02155 [Betaproteobacteria bacterium]
MVVEVEEPEEAPAPLDELLPEGETVSLLRRSGSRVVDPLAAPLPVPLADPLAVPVLPPSWVVPVPLADPAPLPLAAPLAEPDGLVVVEELRRLSSVEVEEPVLLPSCVIEPPPLADPAPLPLADPLAEHPAIALNTAAAIAVRRYLLATIFAPFSKRLQHW